MRHTRHTILQTLKKILQRNAEVFANGTQRADGNICFAAFNARQVNARIVIELFLCKTI